MPTLVQDLGDPRLAPFADLKAERSQTHFVVEGEFAVRRLLESDFRTESLLCTPAMAQRLDALWRSLDPRPELYIAPSSIVSELVGFEFSRGCLAAAALDERHLHAQASDFVREFSATSTALRIVAGERITDPSNVGAIVRNARAFGAAAVILDRRSASPFSRRAIRASMGNVFRLPVVVTDALEEFLTQLHRDLQASVLAASLDPDAIPLPQAGIPPRSILLLGNEGYGLSPGLAKIATHKVVIPMEAETDSVNVAAASAIFLYALRSQVR